MAASLQSLAYIATLLLLLVLVPHACTAATNTALQDSCERYAGGDRSSSDYDYCVSTLQRANKTATTTDAVGLARIAARLARATASATRTKLAALQQQQQRNNETQTLPLQRRRDCLATCAKEYAAAVRRLGHAALAISRGNVRSWPGKGYLLGAQHLFEQVTGTAARCDDAFAVARLDSPLDDDDFELDEQVELASAILPQAWLSPPPAPARTT